MLSQLEPLNIIYYSKDYNKWKHLILVQTLQILCLLLNLLLLRSRRYPLVLVLLLILCCQTWTVPTPCLYISICILHHCLTSIILYPSNLHILCYQLFLLNIHNTMLISRLSLHLSFLSHLTHFISHFLILYLQLQQDYSTQSTTNNYV
jgi:hypothetical protein